MTTIVTGWTGRGYDALGDQFIRSFFKYWPDGNSLMPFIDRDGTDFNAYAGTRPRYIDECEGLAAFQARHANNPGANGRVGPERLREREKPAGYSFRFDAVKFATQLFIPEAAAKHLPDGEIMAWLDADVVTTAQVPDRFIERIIGKADLTYFGRTPKHSEIGFWAVKLSPVTREFLTKLADVYRTDFIFKLAETHSAYVFDAMRKKFPELRQLDLTPGGRANVFPASPLGPYLRHLKGKRKWPSIKS